MAWGTLQIGALVLKETDILTDATNANTGERAVKAEGRETTPGTTLATLEAVQEDIMSLIGRTFPVQFQRKTSYNGFYTVTDTNAEFEKWVEGPAQIRWSLSLLYLGPDNTVDIESRLANVVRANDFALVGERWHAPAIGHYAYQVGTASPATVVRTGADGAMTVYRGIPAATSPRWGSSATTNTGGRVRILQGALERVGVGITLTPTGWEMNNGLVRVKPETIAPTSTLRVGVWSGGSWREKAWDVRIAGVTIDDSHFKAVTVLRNDPEACSLRIVAQFPSVTTRYIIDCTIRRGSRFVECYVQRPSAGEISCIPDVNTAWVDNTVASGYVIEITPDVDGNKAIVGSAKACTLHAQGGITKLATTTLDFYVGVEAAGLPLNLNPYFETDASDWGPTGGTFVRSTAQFHQGAASGLLTPDGVNATPRAETTMKATSASVDHRFQAWVRCAVARNVQLTMNWFDAGAVYLSTASGPLVAVLANTWTFLDFTATPAVGTGRVSGNVTLPATPPVGATTWIDEAMVQVAPVSGDLSPDLRNQYIGAMAEKTGVMRR